MNEPSQYLSLLEGSEAHLFDALVSYTDAIAPSLKPAELDALRGLVQALSCVNANIRDLISHLLYAPDTASEESTFFGQRLTAVRSDDE